LDRGKAKAAQKMMSPTRGLGDSIRAGAPLKDAGPINDERWAG
jgi:hypothetical protein